MFFQILPVETKLQYFIINDSHMFLWTGKTWALITYCYIRLNILIVSTKRETCPIEYERQLFAFTFIAVTWFLFSPLDHNLWLCITLIGSQTKNLISEMWSAQDDIKAGRQWDSKPRPLSYYFMLPISVIEWMLLKILGLLWHSFHFPIYSIWS